MKAIQWQAAVKRATEFITKSACPDGATKVNIYTWVDNPLDAHQLRSIGLRVAEVSFWTPAPDSTAERPMGAASSFMQVDVPWGAAVCLLTERLVIAYAEDWPAEEVEEEEQRLVYAMRGE